MTAQTTESGVPDSEHAGASFHKTTDWYAINWIAVNRNVSRLQARIVKATQQKKWGKVQSLQRLLTHSFSGKALAVKRVTENQGKDTPGVDQITWNTPQDKIDAVYSLKQRGYQPLPLRRIYIPKKNGKKRPLGIPVMKDRAMQALYLLALAPVAETTADTHSYGFRPQRSTADAIEQCFLVLGRQSAPQWILEGDIKGCFDKISHEWLLTHIPVERGILRKWLKAGFMDKRLLYPTEEGTPQGGIISPVLANMALDGLQRLLKERFPSGVSFCRYADDFIVTGRSRDLLEQHVKPLNEGTQINPKRGYVSTTSRPTQETTGPSLGSWKVTGSFSLRRARSPFGDMSRSKGMPIPSTLHGNAISRSG
jgi:RNA-directed DNA polymerase